MTKTIFTDYLNSVDCDISGQIPDAEEWMGNAICEAMADYFKTAPGYHSLEREVSGIRRRISDNNKAIDEVNERLDDEVHLRFAAVSGHQQQHEKRISALEGPRVKPISTPHTFRRLDDRRVNQEPLGMFGRRQGQRRG